MDYFQSRQQQRVMLLIGYQIVANINGRKYSDLFLATFKKYFATGFH